MGNICPVCKYKDLQEPPYDEKYGYGSDSICPCCGFQFGLDNFDYAINDEAHKLWRKNWIKNGCQWYSKSNHPPKDWNAKMQLGYI